MLSSRTITASATGLVTAVLLSTPSAHTVVVGPTGERAYATQQAQHVIVPVLPKPVNRLPPNLQALAGA